MKLESVRLQHAKGLPDYYIANQVYYPSDEDYRERGNFVILLGHQGAENGTVVSSLINTLIREYYRQNAWDRLECFEQALVRVNDQLKQLGQHTQGTPVLHGVIALVINNEVHLTYIGQSNATLVRDGANITLTEPGDDDTSQSFSIITSGSVYPEDILILLTKNEAEDLLQQDLSFALDHAPFFESARAYARVLKEHNEPASVEGVFVRFNNEEDVVSQVYIDGPLETTGERLDNYKKALLRQASFLGNGVEQVYRSTAKQLPKAKPNVALPRLKAESILSRAKSKITASTQGPLLPQVTKRRSTASAPTPSPLKAEGYEIKTYWQEPRSRRAAAMAREPQPVTLVHEFSTPLAATKSYPLPRARTLYLLGGILLMVILAVQVVNKVPHPVKTPSAPTINVDALVTQADNAQKAATKAQIQGDTATAIDQYMLLVQVLKQIPQDKQTEKSKALLQSGQDALNTLTKATPLKSSGAPVSFSQSAEKVLAVGTSTYIFAKDGTVQAASNGTTHDITGLPTDIQFVDAAAMSNLQTIYLFGQTLDNSAVVYAINAATGVATQVTRSDKSPWPQTQFIAGNDKYVYLVGASLWKGTPKDTTLRLTQSAKSLPDNLNALAYNNGTFYFADTKGQITKLVGSNSPAPLTVTGVPERFLPNKITRLLTSPKGTSLYVFDAENQRILETSPDGAYRKQYTLPSKSMYTSCDVTDTGFVCATQDNQLQTLVP